ncbi:MAG TPA: metallophosphoesterase family protein [Candidatus Udaeobacter sp.]|jgi:putative phosphoesterase|nr:metallophosphoesterase family protein [Candidatus Udaeobacter sp.]
MAVAALYDIHGNLPALDAVLDELRRLHVDRIVIGGDVVPGPMPRECLRRLLGLDPPVQFIHGNCERAVLAQMVAGESGEVTYWGTTSGRPMPAPDLDNMRWTASQLYPEFQPLFASWPKTLQLEIPGIGQVLFCHGTPVSETDIFTRLTPDHVLKPLFEPLGVSLVVCGHTHMQFDRMIGTTRVVNAGSVGMPFGRQGACWALLGPDVQLRRTSYDFAKAADRLRTSDYPGAPKYADDLLQPPDENEIVQLFEKAALK